MAKLTRQERKAKAKALKQGNNPGPVAVVEEPKVVEAAEPQVTHLEPGEGTEVAKTKVEITYECECCGKSFISGRARQGEKLCVDCIEIRRALKGFLKRGLNEAEILKRGRKLLGVKKEV